MIKTGIYRHFKSGNLYQVICQTKNRATDEDVVVYYPLYGNYEIGIRTLANFTEEVDRPDFNYKGPRFVLVEPCRIHISSSGLREHNHSFMHIGEEMPAVTHPDDEVY